MAARVSLYRCRNVEEVGLGGLAAKHLDHMGRDTCCSSCCCSTDAEAVARLALMRYLCNRQGKLDAFHKLFSV